MYKYIEAGIMQILSDEKAKKIMYEPHNFCKLSYAVKLWASTLCRPVTDSSCYHPNCSLNLSLYKGPNVLSNMKYIFLSFLLGKYGLTTDLKSAYHSVETTEISNNLRLLVWVRDINGDKTEWNDNL